MSRQIAKRHPLSRQQTLLRRDQKGKSGGVYPVPAARALGVVAGCAIPNDPFKNELLASLSSASRHQIERYFDRVTLSPRQILAERNQDIAHAYFIESGAASLSVTAEGCGSVEIVTLGRRDFAGYPLALGTRRSPHRCVMQVGGYALRIKSDDLIELINRNEELRTVLLQHVQIMLIQSSQLIACNIRHELKQRLPRWLLETSDKLCSDEVPVTHDTAAYALGVRRAGITTAIAKLEQDGLVVHRRGNVTIVDREGLERVSCDCHRVVKSMRERCISPSSQSTVRHGSIAIYAEP